MLSTLSNWFGLVRGRIFGEPPHYVDKNKLPGNSPIPQPTILSWLKNSPFILITSPNFVWSLIALFIYFYFPYYSIITTSPISLHFLYQRLPIWLSVVFGYTFFWHVTLHIFKFASRPFIVNRPYNIQKVLHNMFWTFSGVVIWTLFENIFCYLWVTAKLPFIYDMVSFHTIPGFLKFIAALMGVPVWRSIHFYFAHRFLHFGPLYQQVHSLHHRNTDVEPFSGLCMHPVEHLYYYSCILPSLFFTCSPFAFLWNGVHLLLSPAASHSGWEDHFQSDAYHYMHHRYFECNYAGTDAAFMDIAFGTFKESFSNDDKNGPKPRDDAKSNLFISPTRDFIFYLLSSFGCCAIWAYFATNHIFLNVNQKIIISALGGFGPVILSCIISGLNNSSRILPVKMTFIGNLIHITMGTLFCSIPITYMFYLAL
jgi:sterol desaturase/sphingolipid hydroxylase (fatty acid hydroxylase superfamily)